jgi:cytochrome c biogenesis protein CcmG, thiol:disulfide interchange protein DsbE
MRRSGAVILAFAFAMLLSACHGADGSLAGPGPPAKNAAESPLLPTTVLTLPSFDFDTFERLLYELRGTPVVVNIWASWCGPCRTETPILVDAAERYGSRVQFLGVDFEDTKNGAGSFLNDHGVPYPSIFDGAGAIHDRLGFVGLPDTVFYGADGQLSAAWTGPLTTGALVDHISALLGTAAAPTSPGR